MNYYEEQEKKNMELVECWAWAAAIIIVGAILVHCGILFVKWLT